MDDYTTADRREALRASMTIIRLSAMHDINSVQQVWNGLSLFEQGTVIASLAQFAVAGVAALANGQGVEFNEMCDRLESDLVIAVDE